MTQVQTGTTSWFNDCLAKGMKQIFAASTLVTPALASEILTVNPDNRTIKTRKVSHYAQDMIDGVWETNGETLIISDDGFVNDGQHRLLAVIDANKPVELMFMFGVKRDTRKSVDQGAARTSGDYLAMDGIKYPVLSSSIAKVVLAYELTNGRSTKDVRKFTNAQVVARVLSDPFISASAAYASHKRAAAQHMLSPTIIGVAHYLLSEINEQEGQLFIDQVCMGENIARGDPAFAVRSYLSAPKADTAREVRLGTLFYGWNKFRTRNSCQRIFLDSSLPVLV